MKNPPNVKAPKSARCPTCGRPLSQESRDPCHCPDVAQRKFGRGVDGRFFVRTILGIAGLLAILSVGLFHAIAYLRTLHGLSGFHR